MKKVSSAGVVLLNERGEVLIFKRGKPLNDYSFPKGKIEINESPLNAAIRECKEETGLDIKIIKSLGFKHYQYFWKVTNEKIDKKLYLFLAIKTGGNLIVNSKEDNIMEVLWLPLSKVKEVMLRKEMQPIINKLEKGIKNLHTQLFNS